MVLDTSDFPRGCRGFAASEDQLGVKVPSARWRLVLRKFRHTKHCRRWEGKLAEQRPPPIRTRDPGEGQSRPSSQFMKALQDQFAHQSKPHMRRNPIGLDSNSRPSGTAYHRHLVVPRGNQRRPCQDSTRGIEAGQSCSTHARFPRGREHGQQFSQRWTPNSSGWTNLPFEWESNK